MLQPRGLVSLPLEISGYVLNYLTLSDILRLSWTTRAFREIAIGHRTYWHSISLSTSSSSALEIFHNRLTAAEDRAVILDVQITELAAIVRHTILPLVAMHLFHIKELTLVIHPFHYRYVFIALQNSAPLLRSLKLQLLASASTQFYVEAPVNILLSRPGVLRSLLLHNISLPQNPCPAFRYVEDFNHIWAGAGILVVPFPRIFMHFPNVRAISLAGCSYPMLHGELALMAAYNIAALDTLAIGWQPSLLFLEQARVRGIRFLSVEAYSPEVVQEIFRHLDGTLHVEIRHWLTYQTFELRLHSVNTGFVRNFVENFDEHDPDSYCLQPNILLGSSVLWSRVTSLVIPSSLRFNIRYHLIELCCVETLDIVCDNMELNPWASDPTLRCPRLKEVRIKMTPLLGCLLACTVTTYLKSVFGTLAQPLNFLELPCENLVGRIDSFSQICSTVRLPSGTVYAIRRTT